VVFTLSDSGELTCAEARSNVFGLFNIKVKARDFIGVIAVKDCEETSGLDYVPKIVLLPVTSNYSTKLEFILNAGATVIIKLPTSIRGFKSKCYVWIDIEDNVAGYNFSEYLFLIDTVKRNSALLSKLKNVLKIRDIKDVVLTVPVETKFKILVNLLIERTLERALFEFNNSSSYYRLSKGELLVLDFRRELIARVGLSELYQEYEEVRKMLSRLELSGFGLISQRRSISKALTLLKGIEEDLSSGKYASAEVRSAIVSKLLKKAKRDLDLYTSEVKSYLKLVIALALLISIPLSLMITKSLKTLVFTTALFYVPQIVAIKLSSPSYLVNNWYVISNSFTYYASFAILVYLIKFIEKRVRKVSIITNFITDSITLAVSNIKRRKTLNFLLAVSVFLVMTSYLSIVSVEQVSEIKSKEYNVELNLNAILVKKINRSAPLPNFVPLTSSLISSIKEQVRAIDVSLKLESIPLAWDNYVSMKCLSKIPEPLGYVIKGKEKAPIMGIIGISPSEELQLIDLSKTLIEGTFIKDSDSDSILLSSDLAKELNVSAGERVIVKIGKISKKMLVKGILNITRLVEIKDINNEPYTPLTLKFSSVTSEGGELLYYPICAVHLDKGLIIVTANTALNLGCVISRVLFLLPNHVDSVKLAKKLAENFELDVWAVRGGEAKHFYTITSTKIVGGFEIGVLLTIVMSLIASLVMNVVYERKREFSIMSTLGFNPTQLQAVIITELLLLVMVPSFISIILSFIGIPNILTKIGVVKTTLNVSVEHTFTALLLMMVMSITTSQPIIAKSIKALSPNIPIRWILERKSYKEVNIPVKVQKELINDFLTFVEKALKEEVRFSDKSSEYLVYVRELRKEEHRDVNTHTLILDFVMSFHASWRFFRTRCKLELKRKVHERYYEMVLYLEPIELHGFHKEHVSYYVGDLMRKIALKWSVGERT